MNKKLIFGSIFATFLLIMIPSISAFEYRSVIEANEKCIIENLQNIDINNIFGKIKEKLNDDPKPTFIFTLLFILLAIISTVLATLSSAIGLLITNIAQIVFQVLGSLITTMGKIIVWVLDLIVP